MYSSLYIIHRKRTIEDISLGRLRNPTVSLLVLLVEGSSVQDAAVARSDKLVGQVGSVMESELGPAVGGIPLVESEALVGCWWVGALAEAIVVTGGAVGDVPGRGRVIELSGVDDAVVERGRALVEVCMARQVEVDGVLEKQGLEDVLAVPADGGGLIGVRKVPGAVAADDDPRCYSAVNRGEVLFQPVELRVSVGSKGACNILLDAACLVRPDKAIAQVSLRIQHNPVDHAVVEAVPEVALAAGHVGWHAPVVPIAGEVGEAGLADEAGVVGDAVVGLDAVRDAAGLVIAGADHPGLDGGYFRHLVVEVVVDRLIDLIALLNGGVRQEALRLLIEPIVGIGEVAGCVRARKARLVKMFSWLGKRGISAWA